MGERKLIQNCQVEFRNKCPFTWDSLAGTDDETTRYCSTCERPVFLCTSNENAIAHARHGDCIAMTMLEDKGLSVMGMPKQPTPPPTQEQLALLAQSRFEAARMKAIRNTKYTENDCPECGFPQPKWHKECQVCAAKNIKGVLLRIAAEPATTPVDEQARQEPMAKREPPKAPPGK